MASSRSWIRLLAAALLTQSVTGTEVDSERFPLSGGVANGVNVQFRISHLKEDVTIDFMTPDRSIVFRWFVDTVKKSIHRMSNISDLDSVQTWGGWPFTLQDMDKEVVFDFYKTKNRWSVSVNSVGTPWFDFDYDQDFLVVHAMVTTNADKMVIQTRPKCDAVCDVSECNSTTGANSCTAGECNARIPTSSRHATCVAAGSDPKAHCCSGKPLPVEFTTGTENHGLWVRVDADSMYLNRACEALGLTDVACPSLNGTNVRISGSDITTHTVVAYSPHKDAEVKLPSYVLSVQPVRWKLISTSTKGLQQINIIRESIDTMWVNDGLIRSVTQGSPDTPEDVEPFWYVNMMTSTNQGLGRYFAYFDDRWTFEMMGSAGEVNHSLLIADKEVPSTECVDDMDFTDAVGNVCANYTQYEWCTEHGHETLAFRAYIDTLPEYSCNGKDSCLYQLINATFWSGPWACCLCGGGYHEKPVLPDPSTIFLA